TTLFRSLVARGVLRPALGEEILLLARLPLRGARTAAQRGGEQQRADRTPRRVLFHNYLRPPASPCLIGLLAPWSGVFSFGRVLTHSLRQVDILARLVGVLRDEGEARAGVELVEVYL